MHDLSVLNGQGFIPGPSEDLEAFSRRVDFCLSLKNDPLIAPPNSKKGTPEILKNPFALTQGLYDIQPDWVPVFFSDWKLAPWHGGAAWIFQLKEDSPRGALLQLRKVLFSKERYLGIYVRDELIAHEMAHVGRMAFDEKKYEELLAYRSSKSPFTRYFSPIIQSPFESRLFVYLLAILLVLDLFLLIQGSMQAYLDMQIFKLIPLGLILFALCRLKKRQDTMAKVESKLKSISEYSKAILYRLTDQEIDTFAVREIEEIKAYMKKETSLRWQSIKESYSLREKIG